MSNSITTTTFLDTDKGVSICTLETSKVYPFYIKIVGVTDIFMSQSVFDKLSAEFAAIKLANTIEEADEPEPVEHDPGPEVDDEGGMSEHRHDGIVVDF